MMDLPDAIKVKALSPLYRGGDQIYSAARFEKTVKEYPYIAIAVAFRDHNAESFLMAEIEATKIKLEKINGLGAAIRSPNKSHRP